MKIIKMQDGTKVQILTEALYQGHQTLVIYQEMMEPFSILAEEKEAFFHKIEGKEVAEPVISKDQYVEKKENPEERRNETLLMETFLDAKTYNEKIEILEKYEKEISDETVELLALTMDAVLEGDTKEMRYDSFMQVLRTRARFEVDRHRP